jgi:crotonobetainyl-CoA:carnitine CoA-transferase CaiB-like acyl-CoA transferase
LVTENNTTTTDNIFSGLKVVDFSSFIAGPGAAVIKVEPPKGELWRTFNKVPLFVPMTDANPSSRSARDNFTHTPDTSPISCPEAGRS